MQCYEGIDLIGLSEQLSHCLGSSLAGTQKYWYYELGAGGAESPNSQRGKISLLSENGFLSVA